MIFALRDEETNALRDEIASVCEAYWLANLPSREMIATQTVRIACVTHARSPSHTHHCGIPTLTRCVRSSSRMRW